MPKVKDSTALEPFSKIKHLEESFTDLKYTQKKKLSGLKSSHKLLTEDVQKLKQDILQNQEIIKDLHDEITSKNEELAKSAKQQELLIDENNTLKLNLLAAEEKFTNLEVAYDKNVEKLCSEITQLQQDIENQNNANKKQAEEYTENYNKLQESLVEKTNSYAELNEKLKELVLNFEEHKVMSSKANEETITALKLEMEDLKTQLAHKDEEIAKLNVEKRELEDSKDQLIAEQSYKIHEIERIFEQPLKRVQPQLNRSSVSPKKVPPFSDQPSTSGIASRPDNLLPARSKQNSQATEISISHQSHQRQSIRRRIRQHRIINSTSGCNDADDSDDSGSRISHFRFDGINNAFPILPNNSSPARGFGRLKRSYTQTRNERKSSESDGNFSQLKRSKN